jgi:C1A family cysteine protease
MAGTRKPKRILNCHPSRGQEKDFSMTHAEGAGVILAGLKIPSSKDLRVDWWKIGNQLDTGSCVGWATADAALRWHFVKAGRIAKTDGLSARFQWMAAKETDDDKARPTTFIEVDPTTLKAALDVARKYGAVKEKVLPFSSAKLYAGEENTFYAEASKLKISGYYNLRLNHTWWKKWLAHKGPVLARLEVDKTFYLNSKTSSYLDHYVPEKEPEGHAVALVGYTADHFIVRNSWGTGWKDRGYAYASYAYAEAAFTESYGVVV